MAIHEECGVFASRKDLGLVGEAFSRDALERRPQWTMAVGHTRCGTTGAANRRNCQPIEVNHQKGHMALAHNGDLSNAAQLRSELELTGAIFHTTSARIAGLIREAGASEIHLRISALGALCACHCDACFTGEYPTEIPTEMRKDRFERKLSERRL